MREARLAPAADVPVRSAGCEVRPAARDGRRSNFQVLQRLSTRAREPARASALLEHVGMHCRFEPVSRRKSPRRCCRYHAIASGGHGRETPHSRSVHPRSADARGGPGELGAEDAPGPMKRPDRPRVAGFRSGRRSARRRPCLWRFAGRVCLWSRDLHRLGCGTRIGLPRHFPHRFDAGGCGVSARRRYVTFEVASYCGLIPAASMIRAALSLSRSTNRVKSGCVMLIGSPPCFTSEARTPGSDRARAMSSASV
jgi:hypothetical protein